MITLLLAVQHVTKVLRSTMHKFLEANRSVLATKELCFLLTCGDTDETQVLKVPGKEPHLIAGRNYFVPVSERNILNSNIPALQELAVGR